MSLRRSSQAGAPPKALPSLDPKSGNAVGAGADHTSRESEAVRPPSPPPPPVGKAQVAQSESAPLLPPPPPPAEEEGAQEVEDSTAMDFFERDFKADENVASEEVMEFDEAEDIYGTGREDAETKVPFYSFRSHMRMGLMGFHIVAIMVVCKPDAFPVPDQHV